MTVKTPEAPDLGKATREGYEADMQTLPLRLMVEQAAAAGESYTDPTNGKVYDFTEYGGDAAKLDRDLKANLALAQGGADISRQLEYQRLQDELALQPQYNKLNLQAQKDAYTASLDAGAEGTRRSYEQELAYLPKFNQAQLAAQAEAYKQSLDLGDTGARRNAALQQELLPGINDLGLSEQNKAYQAAIAAGRQADPGSAALRDALLKGTADDLAMGSNLDAGQTARTEQSVRRGQAARGNILGPTATVEEAMALTGYGDQLKTQRQSAAFQALGTQPLTPQFTTQTAVNTVMPQLQAQNQLNTQNPNFQATTSSGANLKPAAVQQSATWTYGNAGAGQFGANYAMDQWKVKNENAQQNAQAMNSMISSGMGMAASFM